MDEYVSRGISQKLINNMIKLGSLLNIYKQQKAYIRSLNRIFSVSRLQVVFANGGPAYTALVYVDLGLRRPIFLRMEAFICDKRKPRSTLLLDWLQSLVTK